MINLWILAPLLPKMPIGLIKLKEMLIILLDFVKYFSYFTLAPISVRQRVDFSVRPQTIMEV
jgi:hypothetical protein